MDQMKSVESSNNKSKVVSKRTKHHHKRNLDKHNDTNNEPHRKKMKFSEKVNALIASNTRLKQENYKIKQTNSGLMQDVKQTQHYKQGMNIYKKEANKWKSKYMELNNKVIEISNPNKTDQQNCSNNSNSNYHPVISIDHNINEILQPKQTINSVDLSVNNNNNNVLLPNSSFDHDITMNILQLPHVDLNATENFDAVINKIVNPSHILLNSNHNNLNASPTPQPLQFSKRISISNMNVDTHNSDQDSETDNDTNDNHENISESRNINEEESNEYSENNTESEDENTESEDENTESDSDDDRPINNRITKKKKNKVKGKNLNGSQRCGRLLLNDAMENIDSMEGWSDARKKAWKNREKNPNSYYYRFLDNGFDQQNGKWTNKEHKLFMKRILEIGVNFEWGIFSKAIPRRVGYSCSNYWRFLMNKGIVNDNYYWYDGKKHKKKKSTKGFSISSQYKKYGFVVNHDKSNIWTDLPKKHPKHPSNAYCKSVLKAIVQKGVNKPKYSNGDIIANYNGSEVDENIVNYNDSEEDEDINLYEEHKNDAKYNGIRDKLLDMGFDKMEVINRISLYNGSGKNADFVYTQLINTFCNDNDNENVKIGSRLRSNKKQKKKKRKKRKYYSESESESDNNNNRNIKYICFEDSFYISVHCHMCKNFFNDIDKYKNHIMKHYESDCTKTWLKCDFNGCNIKPKTPMLFIRHISTHTHDKPYKCNIKINGKKCQHATGYKHTMKKHWNTHFEINENNNNNNNSNNNNNNKDSSESDNESVLCNDNFNEEFENESDFEDNYYVSVHCHICKKFFGDYYEYRDHIKDHYINDSDKIWKQCEFGCKKSPNRPLFSDPISFISHIATHTKEQLFNCNVIINGNKCSRAYTLKESLRRHWLLNHRNTKKDKDSDSSCMDNDESSSDSISESDNSCINEFENDYYVSILCHICQKHYNNIGMYKNHIKKHYTHDNNKQWLQCDFGCLKGTKPVVSTTVYNFILHIATHTGRKPFKCNVMDNGIKCTKQCGSKGVLRQHWQIHHSQK